jgi:signal transduction histidine kinase
MRSQGHGMDSTLAHLILRNCRIAYAITDDALTVVEMGGEGDILCNDHEVCLGQSLPDLVPELIGLEDVLADILGGDLPRFELAWANRETGDGQTIYLTMVDLPHRDRTGQIAGILHMVQDVTEMGMVDRQLAQNRNELRLLQDQLTRQNAELAAANAELRRLDELKSAFVSVAAHELRTPLAPIRGYVEVLLDEDVGSLTDEQREYLQTVERSARRLLTLTSNLLDVTRIEAGRLELVLQSVDLSALVKAIADEYGPQLEGRAQQLTLRIPSDMPPALCDETRAAQIVGNLLSNASKYTPQGGRIAITVGPAEEDGFLEVSVADNGVGIPTKDQPRLFDRFFRAQSAVLTGASGAGLGLHIARSLIELHGGRIWFESELSKGSTFHVTFPVADEPALTPIESARSTET